VFQRFEREVWTARADGTGDRRILDASPFGDAMVGDPVFGPDGRVAFTALSGESSDDDVPSLLRNRVHVAGRGATAAPAVADSTAPAWSARGLIAYVEGGSHRIVTIRPDGGGRRVVVR